MISSGARRFSGSGGVGAGVAALLAVLAGGGTARAETVLTGGTVGGQTWTPAGSPYFVQGDILVQAGGTLTIQAGTTVQFANSDMQRSGVSTYLSELIVDGTLIVTGTAAAPVTFQARTGTNVSTWYGIRVTAGAAAVNIVGAVIQHASFGVQSVMTGAPLNIARTRFDTDDTGISAASGTASLTEIYETAIRAGITLGGNGPITATVSNCVLVAAMGGGYGIQVNSTGSSVRIVNCTIDRQVYGVYVTSGTTDIVNSIITNGTYGVYRTGIQAVTITYSDVWNNNSYDYVSVNGGTGTITTNPQYVSATDFHLQPSSVCIDAGTNTGAPDHDIDQVARPQDGDGIADPDGSEIDMGAYELVRPGSGTGAGGASGTGSGGASGTGSGGASGTGSGGASGTGSGGAGGTGSGGASGTGSGGASGSGGATGTGGANATGSGGASATGSGGANGAGGATAGAGGSTGSGAGGATGTGGSAAGAGGASAGAGGSPATGAGGSAGGASPDGSTGGVMTGGSASAGCGCSAGGSGLAGLGPLLAAAAALLRSRRRRRGKA